MDYPQQLPHVARERRGRRGEGPRQLNFICNSTDVFALDVFQLCSIPDLESDVAALLLVITAAVVIACILIVAGAISTISGKKKTARLLSIGLIVLAITAALFAVIYLTESDGTVLVGGPTFPLLCALSSLIGAIVGFSAKKAQ